MNIGDVFSRMMGGRFKATRHRVIDIGVDRYSIPFFLEPAYDGDIGLNFMSKVTGSGREHVVERYGLWVIHQRKHLKQFFEFRALPEFESCFMCYTETTCTLKMSLCMLFHIPFDTSHAMGSGVPLAMF